MSNIALLVGDTVIYWNHVIAILGIIAGLLLAFALCSFTRVKKSAAFLWFIFAVVLSFFFSRMLYYYCQTEQFQSLRDAMSNPFDSSYSVAGMIAGALLAALIILLFRFVGNLGKLLDTVFPGVVLSIAIIRLSHFFTDVYHSRIAIQNVLLQRLPFAVLTMDEAGNSSYVFAPFLISAIILFITAFVTSLTAHKKLRRAGDLFLWNFIIFSLSEMVLESTRYDSLKLHSMLLPSLNTYISFISFSMFVFGVCVLIVFFVNFAKAIKAAGKGKPILPLIIFILAFLCFGVSEYLVQRYTTMEMQIHLAQAGLAVIMAICIFWVIKLKNTRTEKSRKKRRKEKKPQKDATAAEETQ